MKKMTMAEFEKSPEDAKMDASGKYGREGSSKDKAADKRMLKAINRKRASQGTKKDKSGSRYHLQNVINRPDME